MPSRGKGSEKFTKVEKFPGYVNQPDVTNINPGYPIRGSQNVVLKDNNRIGVRKGYQVYGAENTSSLKPITASDTFANFKGDQRLLRAYDTTLEYEYAGTFYTLLSSLTSVDFHFCTKRFLEHRRKILRAFICRRNCKHFFMERICYNICISYIKHSYKARNNYMGARRVPKKLYR